MMMSLEHEMFGQNEFVITDDELLNRLSAQIYLSGEPEIFYDYGTQLSFSNGCTIFNYGYYTSSGFTITSTESLCLYEPAGLVYMLTVPESGGGGSTGGTESGTPGSTNTDDEECKRGFVGVTEFDEQGELILPCTPNHNNTFDSTLLTKISQSCSMQMDSLYNWGMSNNFREQSFIVVKKGDSIYPKNFLPGNLSGDMTRVNYLLDVGETLLAFVHTHAEDTVRYYRTSFSPEDLIKFNQYGTIKEGYTAIIEVGNARYALFTEDPQLYSVFNIARRGQQRKLYLQILQGLQISNKQIATELAWVQYLGSATVSGIGFYKSTAPDKNNFIKLNP
ncbi:MAG: hypothetical protein KF829_10280 [Ferruginibacter sp.]|nr:hypothetical protein [Ferruginibacter sp.]